MAKIYETEKDLERDYLKQHAKEQWRAADKAFDSGIIGALVATGSRASEQFDTLRSAVTGQPKSSFFSGLNKVATWLGVGVAVIAVYNWFRARTEATKADAKLQVLGREEVSYPPLAPESLAQLSPECNFSDRLKQEEVAQTTVRQL